MTAIGSREQVPDTPGVGDAPVPASGGDEETRARDTVKVLRTWVRQLRPLGEAPVHRRSVQ